MATPRKATTARHPAQTAPSNAPPDGTVVPPDQTTTDDQPPVPPEDVATQEAGPAPAPSPTLDPSLCVNCGQPAVWKTTNPGASPAYFCDYHAQQVYPGYKGLERIDASTE